MNEKKLISVIMSCFNNEESIQSSVESILNQSYHEFEFLIVDDCSEDNTFEILNYLKSNLSKSIWWIVQTTFFSLRNFFDILLTDHGDMIHKRSALFGSFVEKILLC